MRPSHETTVECFACGADITRAVCPCIGGIPGDVWAELPDETLQAVIASVEVEIARAYHGLVGELQEALSALSQITCTPDLEAAQDLAARTRLQIKRYLEHEKGRAPVGGDVSRISPAAGGRPARFSDEGGDHG